MYYVFGATDDDGDLIYFIDREGNSIFDLDTREDAEEMLKEVHSINPKAEIHVVLPNSAKLCECP